MLNYLKWRVITLGPGCIFVARGRVCMFVCLLVCFKLLFLKFSLQYYFNSKLSSMFTLIPIVVLGRECFESAKSLIKNFAKKGDGVFYRCGKALYKKKKRQRHKYVSVISSIQSH